MHTNRTYAIYWVPSGYSVSSDYRSLLDRFLGDVAADSGRTSNVYYSDTSIRTAAASSPKLDLRGIDRRQTPYPASGCSDTVSQTRPA